MIDNNIVYMQCFPVHMNVKADSHAQKQLQQQQHPGIIAPSILESPHISASDTLMTPHARMKMRVDNDEAHTLAAVSSTVPMAVAEGYTHKRTTDNKVRMATATTWDWKGRNTPPNI